LPVVQLMTGSNLTAIEVTTASQPGETPLDEKNEVYAEYKRNATNPVIESAEFALLSTNIVQINDDGVRNAAHYIEDKLRSESYTPRTWRTHPLHVCPPEPYSPTDPLTKTTLDWIFLISSLNFSFWSEKEGRSDCYGVEWQEGWDSEQSVVWRGYWSLLAALNRALQEGISITDPAFYSSELLCPDSVLVHVFRPAARSIETIPLLNERIVIMREVGSILCARFGGSFQGFLDDFQGRHSGQGTAVELVQMVAETFPSFRDETWLDGRKVYIWKRAQILVAEMWAAFFPPSPEISHPIFPGPAGPAIQHLTMFADYRVPQILHHLRILTYPPSLVQMLQAGTLLAPGSREEISVRAASVIAVERLREEITQMREKESRTKGSIGDGVCSVLIDFYLWDLAKKLERGDQKIEGIDTAEIVPAHRTRSIWY